MEKCTVKESKHIIPCENLQSVQNHGNPTPKSKGVFAWALHNASGPTRTFFGVKSGDHVRKGLVFNFCPFCGEDISMPFMAEES